MTDIIQGSPKRIEKPWGHEEIWAYTRHYVGKILVVKKGCRLSYQYHRFKEETLRVLDGVVDLEYENNGQKQVVRLVSADIFHISPCMKHRVAAVEDCRILEVSTPHLDDIVRVEDDYGRAQQ